MKLLNSLKNKGGKIMEEKEIIPGFTPDTEVPVADEETTHYNGEMEEI